MEVQPERDLEPADRIASLKERLSVLRAEMERDNDEARRSAEKRNMLNEQFKRVNGEIQASKKKRDELNSQVKALKAKRDEVRSKIDRNRNQTKILDEKLRNVQKTVPFDAPTAQRMIQEIEWKIQTNTLDLKKENELIRQIKFLESKMPLYRQIRNMKSTMEGLREETRKLSNEADEWHRELSELAQRSEIHHKRMIELVNIATQVKTQSDQAHKTWIECRKRADQALVECAKYMSEIRGIRSNFIHMEKQEKSRREQEARRRVEEAALEKLKDGRKLSFDEFKALVGKGII